MAAMWCDMSILTLYLQATQKCVIALPRVVDGSRISAFSYTLSCTCVWHLIWLTYRFKFIVSLMQDVGSQVIFKRPGNWGYLIKRPSGRQSVNGNLRKFVFITCVLSTTVNDIILHALTIRSAFYYVMAITLLREYS
jgi:hypothetical protein